MIETRQLEIVAEQLVRPKCISLKMLYAPKLDRNLISELHASLMFGVLLMKILTFAHLGTGEDAYCYFDYSPVSGLFDTRAIRSRVTPECV